MKREGRRYWRIIDVPVNYFGWPSWATTGTIVQEGVHVQIGSVWGFSFLAAKNKGLPEVGTWRMERLAIVWKCGKEEKEMPCGG